MCLLWSVFRLGAAILPQTGSGLNSTVNLVARNKEIKMRSWSSVDNRSRGNRFDIPQGGHEDLLRTAKHKMGQTSVESVTTICTGSPNHRVQGKWP